MTAPFTARPGEVTDLGRGLRRILAPNPSAFTGPGTNTYLLGRGAVAVIDPGPDLAPHQEAILAALGPGEHISHILVTHAHGDHSALAPALARHSGAPVLAFGDSRAGRSAVMQDLLSRDQSLGGGEGVDHDFAPDQTLADGARLTGADWQVEALWTPGHMGNHLSFDLGDGRLLTGDLVMGWSSSIVSPPDGDIGDFMASCQRLAARRARQLLPGHGGPIEDPAARLDWLIRHRKSREAAVLAALEAGPATADALVARVYDDIAPALHPAARRNLLAHLIELVAQGRIEARPALGSKALFGFP
ncbi:MBL fold metallo-hydrolase [Pseudooceanicola sp. CBS1P-1]|uniref:MBL fold metallo-hydrolase n=1 Tax=Pseudooceanicola albus TaxID=2692189 RepID=A0A6L7FZU3_9RHOB|nr:MULTISPECIES: MBL fold metallo-hydrolase [Pseudooceanicola]MBT9383770.1 MBL fold metallo-hydrolase [Pseudooceanicola endophyticus]MXN17624.1 MBL fold metallo-hydrolase [Pseudooceanicola albus]